MNCKVANGKIQILCQDSFASSCFIVCVMTEVLPMSLAKVANSSSLLVTISNKAFSIFSYA